MSRGPPLISVAHDLQRDRPGCSVRIIYSTHLEGRASSWESRSWLAFRSQEGVTDLHIGAKTSHAVSVYFSMFTDPLFFFNKEVGLFVETHQLSNVPQTPVL